jgi:hypothetical protein
LVSPWIANAIYLAVALMWLVPDRRIERQLEGPTLGSAQSIAALSSTVASSEDASTELGTPPSSG